MSASKLGLPGVMDPRVLDVVAKLRHKRLELGITQEQVASQIGLHREGWTEVEQGRRHLRAEELIILLEYFGATLTLP